MAELSAKSREALTKVGPLDPDWYPEPARLPEHVHA
jgi:hypothetical protein